MPSGPLAFASRHAPRRLEENEEAALTFAAAGVTGHALADLCYAPGQGGNIMNAFVGRASKARNTFFTCMERQQADVRSRRGGFRVAKSCGISAPAGFGACAKRRAMAYICAIRTGTAGDFFPRKR